jgi:hypothetical protein
LRVFKQRPPRFAAIFGVSLWVVCVCVCVCVYVVKSSFWRVELVDDVVVVWQYEGVRNDNASDFPSAREHKANAKEFSSQTDERARGKA